MSKKSEISHNRKRGIQASRVKLEKAMANAGFRTQAALASHIADLEKLDSAPRDFVSRIFRERSVAPSSIERVANALDVEAYSLYKSSYEIRVEDTLPLTPINTNLDRPSNSLDAPLINNNSRKIALPTKKYNLFTVILILFGLVLSCLIALTIYLSDNSTDSNDQSPTSDRLLFEIKKPAFGKFSIVISNSQILEPFIEAVHTELRKNFSIIEVKENKYQPNLQYLVKDYQSDFAIGIEIIHDNNFVFLNASLHTDNHTLTIWSAQERYSHLEHNAQKYAEALSNMVNYQVKNTDAMPELNYTSDLHTTPQKYYLEGRNLLEHSQNELNIKSSESRFTNAIKHSPNFAEAHAGLCEALVLESWMGDEKQLLEDAQISCSRATELKPSNHYVVASTAFMLRRTGRINEAINLLTHFHETSKPDFETSYALGVSQFEKFRKFPSQKQLLAQARLNLENAIDMAPKVSKVYNSLGLLEWTSGNYNASILAFENALRFDKNELLATNLGTLNFCQNNLADAMSYYKLATTISPTSYFGIEQLGMVYYYQENFTESLKARQKALKIAGEGIHQMWGAIADTYIQLNDQELAKEYFEQALTMLNRDILRGNSTPSDEVYRIYYLTKLNNINNQPRLEDFRKEIDALRSQIEGLDSAALLKLAIIESMTGNAVESKNLLSIANQRCPVFKNNPDIHMLIASHEYDSQPLK